MKYQYSRGVDLLVVAMFQARKGNIEQASGLFIKAAQSPDAARAMAWMDRVNAIAAEVTKLTPKQKAAAAMKRHIEAAAKKKAKAKKKSRASTEGFDGDHDNLEFDGLSDPNDDPEQIKAEDGDGDADLDALLDGADDGADEGAAADDDTMMDDADAAADDAMNDPEADTTDATTASAERLSRTLANVSALNRLRAGAK